MKGVVSQQILQKGQLKKKLKICQVDEPEIA